MTIQRVPVVDIIQQKSPNSMRLSVMLLYNSYTMGTGGLPDIYTLSPRALGVYITQTTHAHGITTI